MRFVTKKRAAAAAAAIALAGGGIAAYAYWTGSGNQDNCKGQAITIDYTANGS